MPAILVHVHADTEAMPTRSPSRSARADRAHQRHVRDEPEPRRQHPTEVETRRRNGALRFYVGGDEKVDARSLEKAGCTLPRLAD
jgi:hypothetical protein